MSILLSCLLTFATFAIEPMNPEFMCADRGLVKNDLALCLQKTKQNLDWYAATACHAISNNKKFIICLNEIKGAEFHIEALDRCVQNVNNSDESILSCIQSVKNKRMPASLKQSL